MFSKLAKYRLKIMCTEILKPITDQNSETNVLICVCYIYWQYIISKTKLVS